MPLILSPCDGVPAALSLLQSKQDCVLLVPTETVYGLVCPWDSESARARIYAMKHRPANKLLAAFLPRPEDVFSFVDVLPETAKRLAKAFMPGPVTLVIPDGKGGTFGFRIPDHPVLLALLKQYGKPLASTSANQSGEPSTLNVSDALRGLADAPDLVIDGGAIAPDSIASTVIQIHADNTWKILRAGPINTDMIENALLQQA